MHTGKRKQIPAKQFHLGNKSFLISCNRKYQDLSPYKGSWDTLLLKLTHVPWPFITFIRLVNFQLIHPCRLVSCLWVGLVLIWCICILVFVPHLDYLVTGLGCNHFSGSYVLGATSCPNLPHFFLLLLEGMF